MAAKIYQVAFALGATLLSNFNASFNAASNRIRSLENQSQKANKGFLGLGEGANKAFKVMAGAAAGIGIAEVAKQSVDLASDLVEVQNVVDTTFGSSSKQIDSWSNTALKGFGLSELQAKQFNGTLGALMKSSGIASDKLVGMSTNLTGLSGDFASFYNLPIEESFEKIKSGISGETEPLKSLGINMSVANLQAYALSQGISKPFEKMTQGEQTLLRYNYLMSISKDVQGDFSKTSDTFANQLRIAKTSLSQMGATIATNALPYLNKLLLLFNNGALPSVGNVFKNAFNSVLGVIDSLKPNFESLWNSIVKFTHISGLDKLWTSFNPGPAIDTIKSTLKGILDEFTGIASFVNNNFGTVKTVLEGVAIGVASYGIALAAVTIKQKAALIIQALSKAWWMATGIIGAYRNGMTLAAIAQDAFNVAMAANPAGMFAIGIAAIIGLVVLIYKNWGPISKFFSKLWTGVKEAFNSFWNWLKSFLGTWGTTLLAITVPIIGIPLIIVQHWGRIKQKLGEVWNALKTSVSNVWNSIVKSISSSWKGISNEVTNGWKAVVNAIKSSALFKIFQSIFKVVQAVFKGILAIVIITVYNLFSMVVRGWMNIFNFIANILLRVWQVVSRIWNRIYITVSGVVIRVWSYIVSVWNRIYSVVSAIMTRVWSAIVAIWNSIYSSVSSVLTRIWNAIVRVWNSIYNSVSSVLTSIWTFIVNVWNNVYSSVSSVVTTIWTTIVNGFNSAASGVTSIFTNMYNSIVNIFNGIWSAIKSIINGGISMLNGFIGGVNNMISKANSIPGVNIGTVGTIPQLANGGYIKHRPGGILANIGEGREDEIVSPVSKLKSIINSGSSVQQPTINYNPQIIIQGNASKDDVVEALSISQTQFNRMMDNYTRSKQRLSFDQ